MILSPYYLLLAIFILLSGCAGPSSPFGAEHGWFSSWSFRGPGSVLLSSEDKTVKVSPDYQVLHRPFQLLVDVTAKYPELSLDDFKVLYEDKDVTNSFKAKAKIEKTWQGNWVIKIDRIKLSPNRISRLEFYFLDEAGVWHKEKLGEPDCSWNYNGSTKHWDQFNLDSKINAEINVESKASGLNAKLISALVAQESGFNPRAVSWAKAIGLTQITDVAQNEITRKYPDFPKYSGLMDLSIWTLKKLIRSGQINSNNEWRLDSKKSIQGSIAYLKYIEDYWNQEELNDLRNLVLKGNTNEYKKLILASYHSGPFRVKNALVKNNRRWLASENLNEARKYVNLVFSYCKTFEGQLATK